MENQITTKTGITEYIASDGRRFDWEYSCKRYQNELNTESALKKVKESKNIIYYEHLKNLFPPFFPDSNLDIDDYDSIRHCDHFAIINKNGIKEFNAFLETITESNNMYLNTDYICQELTEKHINKIIAVYFDEESKLIEAIDIDSFKKELQVYFNNFTNKVNLKEE